MRPVHRSRSWWTFLEVFQPSWCAVGLREDQSPGGRVAGGRGFRGGRSRPSLPARIGTIFEQPLAVGIKDLAAVGVIGREDVFDRELLRVGGTVPAPLRLRAQLNTVGVILGKGLETGDVDGKGELPVADRERRHRIGRREQHVVPGDQGMAIDRALAGRRGGSRRLGIRRAEHGTDQQDREDRLTKADVIPNTGGWPHHGSFHSNVSLCTKRQFQANDHSEKAGGEIGRTPIDHALLAQARNPAQGRSKDIIRPARSSTRKATATRAGCRGGSCRPRRRLFPATRRRYIPRWQSSRFRQRTGRGMTISAGWPSRRLGTARAARRRQPAPPTRPARAMRCRNCRCEKRPEGSKRLWRSPLPWQGSIRRAPVHGPPASAASKAAGRCRSTLSGGGGFASR